MASKVMMIVLVVVVLAICGVAAWNEDIRAADGRASFGRRTDLEETTALLKEVPVLDKLIDVVAQG